MKVQVKRQFITHVKTIYQTDPGRAAADGVEEAIRIAIETGEKITVTHNGTEYTIDPVEILSRILNPPKAKMPPPTAEPWGGAGL